MKIIFLDIDGVMNTNELLRQHGMLSIGDVFLARLESIVKATNAEIVLSSTWRLFEEYFNIVKEKLGSRGMCVKDATIEIKTKLCEWVDRSEEIKEWLERHPEVDKFAILDDCDDAGVGLGRNFFQTDMDTGLTEAIKNKVIKHLNSM